MDSIDNLDLTVRAYNSLKGVGIQYIEELKCKSDQELLEIKHFNEKCLDNVKGELRKYKLKKDLDFIYFNYPRRGFYNALRFENAMYRLALESDDIIYIDFCEEYQYLKDLLKYPEELKYGNINMKTDVKKAVQQVELPQVKRVKRVKKFILGGQ